MFRGGECRQPGSANLTESGYGELRERGKDLNCPVGAFYNDNNPTTGTSITCMTP